MPTPVSIRLAQHEEFPLVRALLGLSLSPNAPGLTCFIAIDPFGPAAVGAAVLQTYGSKGRLWVEVIPSRRRQGHGQRLCKALLTHLTASGKALSSWRLIGEPPSVAFCEAMGFSKAEELATFETPIEHFLDYFSGWMERFQRRGSIPENLHYKYGAEADLGDAKRLLSPLFGAGLQIQMTRIAAHGLRPDDWLFTIHEGDHLWGACLGHIQHKTAICSAYAANPKYRHGWESMVGRYLGVADIKQRHPQLETVQATAGTQFTDTMKMAERLNADFIQRGCLYCRKVESS